MSNNLGGTVTKFTSRLDQIIEQETKTSFLNLNSDLLGEFSGAGEIKLPTIVTQGLGDYDRADGFAAGDATLSWKTYALRYDRGREFSIDAMDDEEHEMLVSANVMAEFARTKVIPEVDALRFALLCAGAGETESQNISTADDALAAVLAAEEHFEALGYDVSGLVLNLSAPMKTLLRQAQPWRIAEGGTPDTRFETFDGMRLNVIPTNRFYSAITLNDGTTEGQKDGGYAKASAGKAINFLIAAPEAAVALQKHETMRYFAPEVNQAKDAHKWQYRLFHDLIVYEQKADLIYANIATA